MKATYRIPIVSKIARAASWVSLLAITSSAIGATQLVRTEYDFHNEGMFPDHFPSQEGWTIDAPDRDPAKVRVTQFGLDYQVPSGALTDGGLRALKLIGDTNASGNSMNKWLTYQVGADPIATGGPVYFAVTVEAETEGIVTDPQELFVRLNGSWGLYVAMKSLTDVIEISGASAPFTFDAGTTYRIVGRLDVTGSDITGLSVWVNPDLGDEATPTVQNLGLTVPLASLGSPLEVRSQKAVTYVDDLQFADSWAGVVPPLPADPGDLVVILPGDNDAVTPGIQVTGGTLFVQVGGVDYVADTPLAPGTEVTYEFTPDTDYILTGWRAIDNDRKGGEFRIKDPTDRASTVGVSVDRSDFTYLGTPVLAGSTKTLVVPIYTTQRLVPRFEFWLAGDIRLRFSQNSGARFRVFVNGSRQRDRSVIAGDGSEDVSIQAFGNSAVFSWEQWVGALAAEVTNPTVAIGLGNAAITADPDIVGGFVIDVEAENLIRLMQSTTWATADIIDPDPVVPDPKLQIDYEADNVGEGESVPLCHFNAVIAEKAPLGLAGVLDYEDLLGSDTSLVVDPRPVGTTPNPPAGSLIRDVDGNLDKTLSVRPFTRKMIMNLGPDSENPINQITVETGEDWYVENFPRNDPAAYGSPAGPAPQYAPVVWAENYYTNGNTVSFFQFGSGDSGRFPVSGTNYTANATSSSYAFDPADKVVMAGTAHIVRNNFQDENPNNEQTLWAQATYDDGSKSVVLFSTNRDRFPEGERDHFFGFEAPSGKYITRLNIWQRGRNSRAFMRQDDLAVVLEGTESYFVSANTINPAYGTVSGGGIVTDGGTTTLTATPGSAPFLGWVYDCDPCTIISTDLSFDLNVYGTTAVKAVFDPHPITFGQSISVAAPNVDVDFFGYSEFNYTVETSPNLQDWTTAMEYSGAGANITHTEALGVAPDQVYVRVDYCAK